MSKIKKLIFKEWMRFFIGATVVLIMVLSLGHILNALLKESSDFKTILTSLLLELPTFSIKIFPGSCLFASLFSINKLKNRNELTAIFASGYSRRKFVMDIGAIGTIIGVFLFFINAYLVPYTKHHQVINAIPASSSLPTGTAKKKISNAISSGKIWFKGQYYFF